MSQAGTNMAAPLPLGYHRAVARAVVLREQGWTWLAISDVLREYHGFDRAPGTWRTIVRGRVTPRPRGVPINQQRAA